MRSIVEELLEQRHLTNKDAFIIQYLIRHKDIYIDEREILMLMVGLCDDDQDKMDIPCQVQNIRDRLVCKLGVDLIEFDPDFGYKISSLCVLFGEL